MSHAEELESVETPEGMLRVEKSKDADCSYCKALTLNGKELIKDSIVWIDGVFPRDGHPILVSAHTSCGGNGCPSEDIVLDFSQTPHRTLEGRAFGDDIARSENGVIFTQTEGTNIFGDPILRIFNYNFETGKLIELKSTPKYEISPISAKKWAWDVLGDPNIRGPLLSLLGPKSFSELRFRTSVGGPLKVGEDGLVFGSGMGPHSQGFAAFVIDPERHLAWAAIKDDNEKMTTWGVIRKRQGGTLQELRNWIAENRGGRTPPYVAPLTPSFKEAYNSPPAPKVENYDKSGQLALNSPLAPSKKTLTTVELFRNLSPSVFVVTATTASGDILQGSAVAVSKDALVTNCHVLQDASTIDLTQKGFKQTTKKKFISRFSARSLYSETKQ